MDDWTVISLNSFKNRLIQEQNISVTLRPQICSAPDFFGTICIGESEKETFNMDNFVSKM